jgi:hypothetical protein
MSSVVDARLFLSALVLIGYLAAARGVGSLYPLSTFPMYAAPAGEAVTRIMAHTAGGEWVEVGDLEGWQCDTLPHLETTRCGGAGGIAYVDREREDFIRRHLGSGGEPIELVRRVFSFDGVVRPPYCVISRCRARRRP